MRASGLASAICLVSLGGLALGGCGGRANPGTDGGAGGTEAAGPTCGDSICEQDEIENCKTCLGDCGACLPGCGDGICAMAAGENCTMCAPDCGACPPCGDGTCAIQEDCNVCAADCGQCTACGDATCDGAIGEDCNTCASDCGTCAVCGDTVCQLGENCSTCTDDCPTCISCMNGMCDPLAGETCTSCSADCTCGTSACMDALGCAMACADMTCLLGCYADVCAAGQMQLQEVLTCLQANCFSACMTDPMGGGCLGCAFGSCGAELGACGSSC